MDRYEEALERAKAGKPMDEVFPELKESEDERIRKWLVELVKNTDTNHSNIKLSENCKLALAYLEKHKEQELLSTEETELNSIAFLEQMGYTCIPPKEQKPNIELIQRSWYMEGYTDGKFKREPMWNLVTGKGGPRYEKNEKYGQPLEQKPKAIRMTGSFVDGSYKFDVVDMPKPAEWSEEDEKMRNAILQDLANIKAAYPKINIQDEFDWLKSLRPQPHWKPSEQ